MLSFKFPGGPRSKASTARVAIFTFYFLCILGCPSFGQVRMDLESFDSIEFQKLVSALGLEHPGYARSLERQPTKASTQPFTQATLGGMRVSVPLTWRVLDAAHPNQVGKIGQWKCELGEVGIAAYEKSSLWAIAAGTQRLTSATLAVRRLYPDYANAIDKLDDLGVIDELVDAQRDMFDLNCPMDRRREAYLFSTQVLHESPFVKATFNSDVLSLVTETKLRSPPSGSAYSTFVHAYSVKKRQWIGTLSLSLRCEPSEQAEANFAHIADCLAGTITELEVAGNRPLRNPDDQSTTQP